MKQFAERMKSARMMSGYSLQDLADKLNNMVSKQALHKYESGLVVPDSEKINLIAAALNVRPDYFSRTSVVELGEIGFRKLSKFPAKEKTAVIGKTKDQLERYLELEEILGIETSFENPIPVERRVVRTKQDVEAIATELREAWNLGSDPIFNALELLEDKHIKVIELCTDESFSGMSTWVNGNIPVIVVNNRSDEKALERKRFTAMHELGHLIMDFGDMPEREYEKLCHYFAGAMLLPEDTLKLEIGEKRSRIFVKELGPLKQQYGISIQAIIYRMKELAIITESHFKQLFFMIRQMGWKTEEPISYTGYETSNRFTQLLYRALAEEAISMSKAAALNNQRLAEFRANPIF
jgi:Zn-dependent peptidase ImmA (M78 family)/DNA-binding XRE family transcriptional regulator